MKAYNLGSVAEITAELKKQRKKLDLSQRELSEKMSIPQSHISNIERGKVDIQTSTLLEMARILGLDVILAPRNIALAMKAIEQKLHKEEKPAPMYSLDEEEDE